MSAADDTASVPAVEPPKYYLYIRAKAEKYLAIGPDAYRGDDFFHMPPASWEADLLAKVDAGFRQILSWRGITHEKPLVDLGIDGFYAMMAVVHFQVVWQSAMPLSDRSGFLDCMHMRHRVHAAEITLYNLVSGAG